MQVLQNLVDLGTAIALRHDEAAARNLLINYPPPPDLSEMDPGALRAWADIAFTADDAELATGFYRRLAATASDSYWPPFQIGRLRLRAKDFAGAVEHLALAAAREPSFGWAWYELCRCHSHLKNTKQLAAAALGFSAADRVELLAPHFRILAEAANHLFEEKLFEESFGIYSIVLDQGCTDDLVRARHAEYFIRKRDFETAIRLLKPCWDAQKLGDWGVRTLARAYSESGDTNSAQEILREIIRKHPRNIAFTRDYICLLCEQGLAAEAAEFFSNARAQLSDRARLELQIVYLSEICEYDKLLKVLAENPRSGGNVILRSLDRAIASCAYKAKDYPTALALIEKRIARFGPSEHITLCRLNTAFATRNWSLLGQFLAEIPPETFARRIEFRVKLFEYYCNSGLMAKAKAALESLGPVSELPRRFLLPVLRYHGERGDWSSVVQIGLDALDHAFNFEYTGAPAGPCNSQNRFIGSCDATDRTVTRLQPHRVTGKAANRS
jgi:tetratricopeptide (TPR) repeat protein